MASRSRFLSDNHLSIIKSLTVEKAIRQQNDLFLRQKIASIEAELQETRDMNKTLGYCSCCPKHNLNEFTTPDSTPEQVTKSSSYTMRNKTRFSFPSGQQLSISEDQPTAQIQFCAATADQCVPKQESPLVKFTHSRRHGRPSMKKIESLETEEKLLDFDKQIKRKTNKSMFVRNNKKKGTVSHFPGGYHIIWKGGLSGSDTLHDSNGFRYSCYVDHRVKLAAYQKPSDSGAVWRCTTSTPSGPKCNFMLLEKDGTFTEKSIAQHKHGRIIDRSKLKCEVCRTRVEC